MDYHYFTEPCLPSCTEMEISTIGEFVKAQSDGGTLDDFHFDPLFHNEDKIRTTVTIEILNTPNIRYIRNISFTRLDFIVTAAGICGIFFGASILSFIEIVYILIVRKFWNPAQ